MDYLIFSFALLAGMAAFFNPCGMAVLIIYVSHYFKERPQKSAVQNITRGAIAGILATLGFITLFVVAGLAINALGNVAKAAIPWVTIISGLALIAIGILQLSGKTIGLQLHPGKLRTSGLISFYEYGVLYALASLGCVLPVFLLVVALATGFASGIVAFLAYALGMGIVMTFLTVALSLPKSALGTKMNKALPTIIKINNIILILVGAYLVYYQVHAGFIIF